MLHHLAQAAAILLLLELLVVVLVFLAVAGGLAFGLRWVRGKSDWAFEKVNVYVPRAQRAVHLGTEYAAKPVLLGGRWGATVAGTAQAIERRVKQVRAAHPDEPAPSEMTSRPVAAEAAGETEALEPEPLV